MPYSVVKDALPAGATSSEAGNLYAPGLINASGEIAGDATGAGIATWSTTGAVTDLPGSLSASAVAIDNSGDVVGNITNGIALLWLNGATQATPLQNPLFGKVDGESAINGSGDSVGYAENLTNGSTRAVRWNDAGAATELRSLGANKKGVYADSAESINDAGVIGGQSDGYAVEWSRNGHILWAGDAGSNIRFINASGAAVGSDAGGTAYWSPKGVETTLIEVFGDSQVDALNNSGDSVGFSGPYAVEWSPTGAYTILPYLAHSGGAVALALNNLNETVGYCNVGGEDVATKWTSAGAAINLNRILGSAWTNTEAAGINNAGDICGTGTDNGIQSAFELLWVPKAGAADGGTYVNPANHGALAASAIHAPEHYGFASVGHGPG